MLQTMRRLAHSWVFKTLMLFLVISFAAWGIGDIFRGNPLQRTVAKTGKASITAQDLTRTFDQSMTRARAMFGPEFTVQQAKEHGLFEQTLDTLIAHADIQQDLKRLGVDASNQEVLDKIISEPHFHDKDGNFNKDMFRQMIAQSGMNESNFMSTAREDLAQQQLFDSIQTNGKLPETIIDEVHRALGQKRIFDVVTIKNNGLANVPAPDDKVLQDFYQQNGQAFMAPEYRGLTIVRLSVDDLAKDIKISDEDLKKEFDAKAADLAEPEKRDYLQTVLQDENKAKQLAKAAQASHDLAAASKAAGYESVPLNGITEKSTPPALKPALSLQAGQVSEPIKSEIGWHVVQLKKITPGHSVDFEGAKDKLLETMKHDQAIESVTRMVNQLDDELAAGHALEDIADSMKLRLIKIPSVDQNGKTPDDQSPAELPAKAEVLKNAFQQNSGEVSPVLDDRQGNYVVVRTDEVVPAAVPPFEKIKDRNRLRGRQMSRPSVLRPRLKKSLKVYAKASLHHPLPRKAAWMCASQNPFLCSAIAIPTFWEP